MKGSDLLVKALENEGVKYIFGVPGEENLDFVESLRDSSIELIIVRHEQGAGFMAATYGRLTGKAGVCLATLGPGATNLVTAAAYAQLGAMPMLMITGQKPITKSLQGQFQIIDVVDMMKPLTKFTKQVVDAHTLPPLVRQAFRLAEQERPGVVHLELPEDIAREASECPIFPIHPLYLPIAAVEALVKAVSLIQAAKHPLLLIGAGANRKNNRQALMALINKVPIPFFATQMGKGVLDERHPWCMGTAALSADDFIHQAIVHADLIINIGHDTVEKPPFIMAHNDTQVIHINYSPARVDEVYFPQLEVIGDLSHTINYFSEHLAPQPHWDFSYFKRVKGALDNHIEQHCADERFPMLPQRVVADVRAVVPSDGILALDNGMYKIWFARNYPAHEPNTVLLDNALATMGAGLPSAMAAKMVKPNQPVIAVCGDGGFMMNSHELEPAVRLGLHIVVLLLRDNGYGMIKWKQANMDFAAFGLDFANPDFVAYANSYGATGHRVTQSAEFKPLLRQCLDEPGVHVLDVPIEYSQNVADLGGDLQQAIARI